jgi:predicted dehydrogenase
VTALGSPTPGSASDSAPDTSAPDTSAPDGSASAPARVVLVGVGGFGRVHAERLVALAGRGLVELVATVDPIHVADPPVVYGAPLFAELPAALDAVGPVDLVIVAAPIGEHFRLAEIGLRAGADVLLEKPPVASWDDFERLLATEEATGRVVQVGFQSLGADAAERFAADDFGIGAVQRVSAVGAWSRTLGYWARSPWAGRRSLDGRPVVDGVVTNPLAHAVATALAVAGARRADDVRSVTADLYRANAIESDDTSVVRIDTVTGVPVTCALTLCAPGNDEPQVLVEGSAGRAVLSYTVDRVEIDGPDGQRIETLDRTDLVENLLAHRRDRTPLRVPLVSTGAFMRVLAAVAETEPVPIDPDAVTWSGDGADRRPVVADVERWLAAAATTGRTFRELGVPWAQGSDPAAGEQR